MHCPTNAWLSAAGSVPAMRLSTVLAACAPSWPGRLAAHPQRLAGRRRRVSGRHDAWVVHAGQFFVGEQPAQRVGARPLRAASSGTPKPAVHTVSALGRCAPSESTTASGRTSRTRRSSRRHRGGAATSPPSAGPAGSATAPARHRRPRSPGVARPIRMPFRCRSSRRRSPRQARRDGARPALRESFRHTRIQRRDRRIRLRRAPPPAPPRCCRPRRSGSRSPTRRKKPARSCASARV